MKFTKLIAVFSSICLISGNCKVIANPPPVSEVSANRGENKCSFCNKEHDTNQENLFQCSCKKYFFCKDCIPAYISYLKGDPISCPTCQNGPSSDELNSIKYASENTTFNCPICFLDVLCKNFEMCKNCYNCVCTKCMEQIKKTSNKCPFCRDEFNKNKKKSEENDLSSTLYSSNQNGGSEGVQLYKEKGWSMLSKVGLCGLAVVIGITWAVLEDHLKSSTSFA